MQPPFVKKFDFRGIYNQEIKDKDAFYLGRAISKTLPLKKILVGWDTRESSKNLAMNFLQALKDSDIAISYLEQCPIDYVTAGANAFDFDFSVMFTGSHNPWDWTGLLMHTKGGASVQGDLVSQIITNYNDSLSEEYTEPTIVLTDFTNFQQTIEEVYTKKMQELIPLEKIKSLKVVVDVGDGTGSKGIAVLKKLLPQVTFDVINDRHIYDADSPHTADPSNIENMQQVMEETKRGEYDCGFAFDSDADRVLAVDETGACINGSLIGSAMIDTFLSLESEMKTFGYAVECGPAMFNSAANAVPVPVGRSILRQMIRDGDVDVAVENVGHFYIKDFFMTDSGAFSIILLLYWISLNGPLSSVKAKHPDGNRTQFSHPQVENQEEILNELITSINPRFAGYEQKKITVDGIRYEFFKNGLLTTWYAFRPSGYEKIEKYYFGSLNADDYAYLQAKIK